MSFVPTDANGREGYLECDFGSCGSTSPVFVAKLGGELPEGWVVVTHVWPGDPPMEHLCPRHASMERHKSEPRR